MTKRSSKTASILAWDAREEKVVHINRVAEGFKDAVCRVCKERLIAANRAFHGRVKAFYFSHRQGSECAGEPESLAHEWAKQILADHKTLLLPGYETQVPLEDWDGDNQIIGRAWSPDRHVELQHIELEKTLVIQGEPRTPDVTASLGDNTPLYIEIHVSNPVDPIRRSFYQRHALNCLEIHVKDREGDEWLELLASPDRFIRHIIEDARREWVSCNLYPDDIHNALEDAQEQAKAANAAREQQAERRPAQEAKKASNPQDKSRSREEIVEQVQRKLVKARQEQWREERQRYYLQQVMISGTKSAEIGEMLSGRYGRIPEVVNVPIPDELAFWKMHRCVWQWVLYEFLVIQPYRGALEFEARHGKQYWEKPYQPGGDVQLKRWVEVDPSFAKYRRVSPGDACRRLFEADIEPSPLTTDAAELLGCGAEELPLKKPRDLAEITDEDWALIPKPALAVQQYFRALRDKGILHEIKHSYGSQGLGAYQLKGRQTPPLA